MPAAVVCCLLLSACTLIAEANIDSVRGIWVLQQCMNAAELEAKQSKIRTALTRTAAVGFSLRVPWNAIDENFRLLDAGYALAESCGKKFSIRFMAGRFTPQRIFSAGADFFTVTKNGREEKIPLPYRDGTAKTAFEPNEVFEREYEVFCTALKRYCAAHSVRLLHLPWFGQEWAEINNAAPLNRRADYSKEKWFAGHARLLQIALRLGEPGILAVELPLSGSGPLVPHVIELLAEVPAAAATNGCFFFQANGWAPNGEWGAPDRETETAKDRAFEMPALRGLQMIQPHDYTGKWRALFNALAETRAVYGEIYLDSFFGNDTNELDECIRGFWDSTR